MMRRAIWIWIGWVGLAGADVIETNRAEGMIWLPVKDAATRTMLEQARTDADAWVRALAEEALAQVAAGNTVRRWEPRWPAPPRDLGAALTNRAPVVQQLAVREIVRQQARQHVSGVVELLRSRDSVVRREAAAALGALGADVSAVLGERLTEEEDPLVRRALAEALQQLRSETGREVLVALLKDERPAWRREAVGALVSWPSESVCAAALPLLGDTEAEVRAAAASTMGRLHCEAAVAGLLALVDDPQEFVQEAAIAALGEMRAAAAAARLRQVLTEMTLHSSLARQQAIAALRRLGDREAAKRVLQIATAKVVPPPPGAQEWSYDDDQTRVEAVRYLADLRDAKLLETMVERFKELPPYSVRVAVAEALTAVTGRYHEAELTVDARRYFMESRARVGLPRFPDLPGVRSTP